MFIEHKTTLGQVLIDLLSRSNQELEIFSSSSKKVKSTKNGIKVLFCQLQRQLLVIDKQSSFFNSAVSVGLCERSSCTEQ